MADFRIQCEHCPANEPCDRLPFTSVPECGAPSFISLELPEDAPCTLTYNLRPTDDHTLVVDGNAVGTYQLAGVLLYKRDAHYIAEVFDARERSWVRYDGYPPACGVGVRVGPPTGRCRHTHGLSGEYYPVNLLYARVLA